MSSLLEDFHPASDATARLSAVDQAPRSPIPSFQLRRSLSGVEVELLIQSFDDRILVIISQNGKVGCLTQASLPAVVPLPPPPRSLANGHFPSSLSHYPPPPPSISLTSLLGSPPSRALHETYVAHVSTLIWWTLQEVGETRRAVVVGLSLDRRRPGSTRDADEDEGLDLDDKQREMFGGVLAMVASWPGPNSQ